MIEALPAFVVGRFQCIAQTVLVLRKRPSFTRKQKRSINVPEESSE